MRRARAREARAMRRARHTRKKRSRSARGLTVSIHYSIYILAIILIPFMSLQYTFTSLEWHHTRSDAYYVS